MENKNFTVGELVDYEIGTIKQGVFSVVLQIDDPTDIIIKTYTLTGTDINHASLNDLYKLTDIPEPLIVENPESLQPFSEIETVVDSDLFDKLLRHDQRKHAFITRHTTWRNTLRPKMEEYGYEIRMHEQQVNYNLNEFAFIVDTVNKVVIVKTLLEMIQRDYNIVYINTGIVFMDPLDADNLKDKYYSQLRIQKYETLSREISVPIENAENKLMELLQKEDTWFSTKTSQNFTHFRNLAGNLGFKWNDGTLMNDSDSDKYFKIYKDMTVVSTVKGGVLSKTKIPLEDNCIDLYQNLKSNIQNYALYQLYEMRKEGIIGMIIADESLYISTGENTAYTPINSKRYGLGIYLNSGQYYNLENLILSVELGIQHI